MRNRLLALLPPETENEDKSFKEWRQYGIYLSVSKGQEVYAVEGGGVLISNEQVRAVKSLGDLPLAVVTRSPFNPTMVGGMPDLPEEINRQLMQQWQGLQTEFEGLSTNSTRFTAVRSGHGVQAEEPRLVAEEYRGGIGIATGNQSGPETVEFFCLLPKSHLNPFVIGGFALALVLIGFGVWLIVRLHRRKINNPKR